MTYFESMLSLKLSKEICVALCTVFIHVQNSRPDFTRHKKDMPLKSNSALCCHYRFHSFEKRGLKGALSPIFRITLIS